MPPSAKPDLRADAVSIALLSYQAERDPVVEAAALVAKQLGGTAARGDQDVQISVPVIVSIGGAAAYSGGAKYFSHLRGDFLKSATIQVSEQVWWLSVPDFLLDPADVVLDVTVRHIDVEKAVQVVVEDQHA